MPGYNQFNMRKAIGTDQSKMSKVKSPFALLFGRNPAELSTVLSTMTETQRITQEAGQKVTFFTVDQ